MSKPKTKTPRAQLDRVRAWNSANSERKAELRRDWEQSPAGREWLRKNQKKKNEARAAWRKKRQKLGLPYS